MEHEKGIEMVEKNKQFKEDLKNNVFYVLIFSISFLVLFFFPFFGSTLDLKLSLPNTKAGWILYVVEKLLISSLNLMIFYSFNEQGRLNVRDNPKYIEANNITSRYKQKDYVPRSPRKYKIQTWSTKGVTIFLGTIASLIGIGQAVLKYDYVSLIAYIITIAIAICFGVMSMMKAEDYWTHEYYDYAKKLEAEERNDND